VQGLVPQLPEPAELVLCRVVVGRRHRLKIRRISPMTGT
jgi:hypothetical protein